MASKSPGTPPCPSIAPIIEIVALDNHSLIVRFNT
jgi:hypothetical protein